MVVGEWRSVLTKTCLKVQGGCVAIPNVDYHNSQSLLFQQNRKIIKNRYARARESLTTLTGSRPVEVCWSEWRLVRNIARANVTLMPGFSLALDEMPSFTSGDLSSSSPLCHPLATLVNTFYSPYKTDGLQWLFICKYSFNCIDTDYLQASLDRMGGQMRQVSNDQLSVSDMFTGTCKGWTTLIGLIAMLLRMTTNTISHRSKWKIIPNLRHVRMIQFLSLLR